MIAASIGALIMLGISPFDLPHNSSSVITAVLSVLTDVVLAALAIFKGRRFLGLLGIFVPLVSLVGAVRLAAPYSPWARRLYASGGRKIARAEARFSRHEARKRRLADLIAGEPSTILTESTSRELPRGPDGSGLA